jgi:sodium/bile acid cotransporter 7
MEKDEEKDAHRSVEPSINSPVEHQSDIAAPSSSSKPLAIARRIWALILEEYFLIGLGVVILISSQVQVPQAHQSLKETVVTYLCVSLIFFITGCTLKTRDLLSNYARWKIHLFVQLSCYLLTSSVIFGVVSACASNPDFMDPGILLGFLLTGCTATTINSNVVMTREAHGNVALTVVQSTLGNFLGPFLTPPLFHLYTSTGAWYTAALPPQVGGYQEIYRRVFKQLGLSLFLPMVH